MQKILITRKIQRVAEELLNQHFSVDVNPKDEVLAPDDLIAAVQNYDGILCTISDVFNAPVLSHATRVKALSNLAMGLDNIDRDAAQQRGIAVYNTPGLTTNSTADMTFALLLAFIRKISEAQSFVRANRWRGWEPMLFQGEELAGKTFGIVGFGQIGQAVARRALGFGLKVVVYHRSFLTMPDEFKRAGVYQLSWEDFLKEIDYVSLHVPLTNETRGLINRSVMEKMIKRPILINMARGGVVVTDDLVEALTKGILRGAALDVTTPEPIPASHPLCMMENCMIIPHIGSATAECREKMAAAAAQNLIDHFKKCL